MDNKNLKVITIDATNSIIEGNLVEIPFIYYGRKQKVTLVQYKWTDSQNVERSIELEGSQRYGLPTPYEFDVLLALLRIRAKQTQIPYGNSILAIGDIDEKDLTIHFTLSEIAKELNKEPSGAILKRIHKALLTLTHTRLTSENSGAIYDPVTKEYLTTKKGIATDVFNNFAWNRTKNSKGATLTDRNAIRLNAFFYHSIVNSYFKYFDFDLYLSLGKNNIAKRLFLLLCKWRNNKAIQVIKLETLYERIPLEESKPANKKNEMIKNAARALEKAGYIKSFAIKDKKIHFTFASEKAQKIIESKTLEKYSLFTDIQKRFLELGFTEIEWMERINHIVANLEYVKALLRYLDDAMEASKVDDPKAYIKKGLSANQYEIPESYYNKTTSLTG